MEKGRKEKVKHCICESTVRMGCCLDSETGDCIKHTSLYG